MYTQKDAGEGIIIEVGVPAIIYIYGTYAREFVSVDSSDCYAKPASSGLYTFDVFTKSADLHNNEVHLNASGNVEISESKAMEMGINVVDLINLGFSASSTYYYRKTIDIAHVENLY